MAEEVLIKINIDKEAAQRNAAQLEKAIAKLGVQRSELTKQLKELIKEEQSLDDKRSKTLISLNHLKKAGKENTEEYKQLELELEKVNQSIEENARKSNIAALQLGAVKVDLKETQKELKDFNAAVDNSTKSINEQNEALSSSEEIDDFSNSVNDANKELKELDSNLDLSSTSLKDFENTLSPLEQKAANLQKSISVLTLENADLSKELKALVISERELDNQRGKALQTLAELEASEKGNTEEAQNLRIEIEQINTAYTENARKAESVSAQLNAVNADIKENKTELRLLNRELEAGDNSLEAQRVALIRLQREYDKFGVGVDGTKQDLKQLENEINQLTDSIKKQEEGTQRFFRNVGNYGNAIQQALGNLNLFEGGLGSASGAASSFGSVLTSAALGPAAIFAAIGAGLVQLFNFQQALEATRKEVQLLTGAQGEALDSIAASIQATAEVNNVDFNETLIAANAATEQLGGSLEENIDLIQKGFSLGANANGEFLDVLKEYPAQIDTVGLGLEEMIAIYSQNVKTGVFGDKGIDTIKEAGLRLRELTPATRSALDAIGLSSDEIAAKLESGEETLFSTIQKVSARLDELPPQSAEVGTAIADIFGGPGEDAGLQYIKTLKDINLNLDEVLEQSGEFATQQYRLTQANEELNLTFNQLLGGADGFFTEAKIGATELLNEGLRGLIDGVISLANWFIELYNNALPIRVAVQAIFITVKNVFDSIGFLIRQVIDGFKDVGGIILAVLKGDFKSIPGLIKDAFTNQVDNVKQYGKDIGENFVEGFNDLNKEIDIFLPFSAKTAKKEIDKVVDDITDDYKNKLEEGLQNVSLEELNQKLSEANRRFEIAKTDNERIAAAAEINKLQNQIDSIEAQRKRISLTEQRGQRLTAERATAQTSVIQIEQQAKAELAAKIAALNKQRDAIINSEQRTAEERLLVEQDFAGRIQALQITNAQETSEKLLVENLRIARIERDEKLNNEKLTQEERNLINEEYLQKVQEINHQSVSDLVKTNLDIISNEQQLALQKIDIQKTSDEQKRVATLKAEQEILQKKLSVLAEESPQRQAILTKIAENEIKLTKAKADAVKRIEADKIKAINDGLFSQESLLIKSLLNQEITENEFNERSLELRRKSIEDKLAITKAGTEEEKRLLDELLQVRQSEAAANRAKVDRERENTNIQIQSARETFEVVSELTRNRTDQEREASAERKQAFQEGSAAYKAAVIAQKTAALAEIAINLQREISSYWATSATAGPAAPAIAIPLTVAAIARAAGATASILRFAQGGQLSEGQSGLASGPTHAEGGIWATNNNRLINFEGNEFIVRGSAAMNNLPALQAINTFGDRIKYNASKDRFAVGGSLSGQIASTQVTNQIINQFNLSQVMKDIIGSIPAPVVTVEDINAGFDRVAKTQVRANQ